MDFSDFWLIPLQSDEAGERFDRVVKFGYPELPGRISASRQWLMAAAAQATRATAAADQSLLYTSIDPTHLQRAAARSLHHSKHCILKCQKQIS